MMIAAIIAAALILRLVNLNQSFWLDEAAQMIESLRPLSEQLDLAADFHPPFYHLTLHFWLYLGSSEIIARLLSVFLGTASVWLIYLTGKMLGNHKAGLLAALLLAVSPYHIFYSQEVRPYMLFAFLSLLSLFWWLKKSWIPYTFVNIMMIYTNYFSVFLISGQLICGFYLRKKTIKSNFLSVLVTLGFFIPWLPMMARQLQVGLGGGFAGWTSVVSETAFRNVPLVFAKFILGRVSFDNNLIYSAVLLPSLGVFILSCILLIKRKEGKILPVLFISSLVLAVAVSFFYPVTAPQRLIFLLPVFYLIIVLPLNVIAAKLRIILFSVVLSVSLLGLSMYYSNPRFQRENWRDSVSFINESARPGHLVLFAFPEPFAPFIWYDRGRSNFLGAARDFRPDESGLLNLENRLNSVSEVYYYSYLDSLTDPEGKIVSVLRSAGFKEREVRDFTGVGFVYRYEK